MKYKVGDRFKVTKRAKIECLAKEQNFILSCSDIYEITYINSVEFTLTRIRYSDSTREPFRQFNIYLCFTQFQNEKWFDELFEYIYPVIDLSFLNIRQGMWMRK
jgi:hypothetical protein